MNERGKRGCRVEEEDGRRRREDEIKRGDNIRSGSDKRRQ